MSKLLNTRKKMQSGYLTRSKNTIRKIFKINLDSFCSDTETIVVINCIYYKYKYLIHLL